MTGVIISTQTGTNSPVHCLRCKHGVTQNLIDPRGKKKIAFIGLAQSLWIEGCVSNAAEACEIPVQEKVDPQWIHLFLGVSPNQASFRTTFMQALGGDSVA